MKDIFKIFTIFNTKEQRYCVFIIFCMLIGAILEAVGIGAILPLVSIMADKDFLNNHIQMKLLLGKLNINTHAIFILFLSVLLVFFYICKNLYLTWIIKLQIDFSTRNQIFYARELLAEYINKPYSYHMDKNSAELLRNVSIGSNIVFTEIIIPAFALLTELITAVSIWIMLIFVDSFTAIIFSGILCIIMLCISKYFRKKIIKCGQIRNEYQTQHMKWLNQGLGSIKETKVLNKEDYFLDKFENAYNKFGYANGYFNYTTQLPRLMIETLVTSGLLILIIIKLILGINPMEVVPLIGVLSLAAFRLMPCANRIINLTNGIKFQMPLFNELYNELISIKNNKKMFVNKDKVKEKINFNKEIFIKNLSFIYNGGKNKILDEVSLLIPQGSFVGIIGKSGAGKTTFIDILLGLLEPSSGKVLVDNVNVFNNIKSWQLNLSYVPQSIYLIDGSIKENIALGIPEDEVDKDKIISVLKMTDLFDFIKTLPQDIDTYIGENGVKLSGGQRQRIGIARALYCNPCVLILDEATSALDSETEKSITNTILRLKGKMTIIAVAQPFSGGPPRVHSAVPNGQGGGSCRLRSGAGCPASCQRRASKLNALGRHLVADFHGCTADLNDPELVMKGLEGACEASGATIISRTGYHFSPYGVTAVVVIAESHLAVHTWPEYRYAAVDLFTCGTSVDTWKAFEFVKKAFGASRVDLKEIARGQLSQREIAEAQGYVAPSDRSVAA